jgi:serine protease AprX
MGTTTTFPTATLANVRTMIGASSGAAAALTGVGVGIALIDTGVVPVPGLPAAQIVNGPDVSFESQSSNLRYLDTYGHGTHMAGIMVGNGALTGNVGIAPKAKLTSIKVGTSSGTVDVSQILAAIDWVVAHRSDDPAYPIRVLNLAYGSSGVPSIYTDPIMAAAEQAWKAGIVVIAAAGNSGRARLDDPANDPFLLSVGSASTKGTVSNTDDTSSTFNNTFNSTTSMTFAVIAPGEGILSLRNPGSSIDTTYPTARQGDYLFRGSGSSQATAVTSAAVALLLQARPTLTPDQVRQLLKVSATTTNDGRKMINVNAAVAAPVPAFTPRTAWSNGTGSLEDARGTVHVTAGSAQLSGNNSIFGPFNSAAWANKAMTQTSWVGGRWMDKQVAGDGWTGTSWASKTWGAATWTGTSWAGQPWVDPSWSSRTWAGRTWAGRTWAGLYWSN